MNKSMNRARWYHCVKGGRRRDVFGGSFPRKARLLKSTGRMTRPVLVSSFIRAYVAYNVYNVVLKKL